MVDYSVLITKLNNQLKFKHTAGKDDKYKTIYGKGKTTQQNNNCANFKFLLNSTFNKNLKFAQLC